MSAKTSPDKDFKPMSFEDYMKQIESLDRLEEQAPQINERCYICHQLCMKAFAWFRDSNGTTSLCSDECFNRLKKMHRVENSKLQVPPNSVNTSPVLAAIPAVAAAKK